MNLLLKRLWIQVSADRKRLGALSVLLAVGLLLWARVLLVSKPPRTAVADQNKQHAQVPTDNNNAVAPTDSLAMDDARPKMRIQLAESPGRDPFVISTKYFPEPENDNPLKKEKKLRREPSDNGIGKKARIRARLQAAIDSMRLEAVLSGTLAVINGDTYRQGDTVPVGETQELHLTLVEVKKRSVTLTYGEQQFELTMKSPQPN